MDTRRCFFTSFQLHFAAGFLRCFLLGCLVTGDAFACPDGCACLGEEQVICNQAGLSAIPEDLPDTTKYLSLGENGIHTLPPDAFSGLKALKSVRLDSNNVTKISEYAFRGLADVDEITLQKNPLDHLASYSFAELRNIARLYLGYNKIAIIHSNAFYNSHNIREVSLVGNPLAVLETGAFTGFSGIQYFYFPTGIRKIEANAFRNLKNVSMLRLERLEVPKLERHSFSGLSNIAGLEIKGSHIGTLPDGVFDGLSTVDYFNLEGNTIDNIESNAFRGMHNISVLMIVKNNFEKLAEDGFRGLAEALKGRKANFTDNHIPCDCRLHLFVQELSKVVPNFREFNYCQAPDDVVGELASIVDLADVGECPTVAPLADDTYLQETKLDVDIFEASDDVEELQGSSASHIMQPLITGVIHQMALAVAISWKLF